MPDIRSEKLTTNVLDLLTSGKMEEIANYLLARTEPLGDELIRAVLYNICSEVAKLQQEKADKR